MRFKKMRFLAVSLAAMLFATSIAPDAYAANTGNAQNDATTEESLVDLGTTSFTVGDETLSDEDAMDTDSEEDVASDDQEATDTTSVDSVSVNDIDPEMDLVGEEDKLNYLYVETKYLDTTISGNSIATENFLASFGDEETEIAEATLTIRNYDTDETFDVYSDEGLYNLILFSHDFTSADQGIYEVVSASFTTTEGNTTTVALDDTGMERIYFGVDEEFEEGTEAVEEKDPEIEMQIVDMSDGQIIGGDTTVVSEAVAEALENAEENLDTTSGKADSNALSDYIGGAMGTVTGDTMSGGKYVVVLDPGHDATHLGAHANGLKEEDLTLKIANYCKAQLQTYGNVVVYMTRTSSACPNGGTSTEDNAKRVEYAQSVGADIYVSIHLNSSESSSPAGAEVYYPNSNYNATIGSRGSNLATLIERQLVALGLGNRGIHIRNSGDGTRYPDGSLADYYGVIRRSKLAGFPGVIVEHAFVSNGNDANFLKSEENLKKLGVADATGIANYFGLTQAIEVKSNAPSLVATDNVNGTATMRVTGVTPYASVSNVSIAVWSDANGQDDLKWYTATHKGNGTYEATMDIANHKREAGKYNIHVYATDVNGSKHLLGKLTTTFTKVTATASGLNVTLSADAKTAIVTATGVKDVSSLKFAVWTEENGQDDLVWYVASASQSSTDRANGTYTYTVNVPASSHKGSNSIFQVHGYGYNGYSGSTLLKKTSFSLPKPYATSTYVNNINAGAGTFQVHLDDVVAPAGLKQIRVAVWSTANQSNLKWYNATLNTATKGADGKSNDYIVNVNLASHQYLYGTYQVHCYIDDNNGMSGLQKTTANLSVPTPTVTVTSDAMESNYAIRVTNAAWSGGIKSMRVAVWSEAGGQDDLKWYDATNQNAGAWALNVPISNHKTAGRYQAHVYVTTAAGTTALFAKTTFNVTGVSIGKVETANIDSKTGTFDAYIRNVTAKSGVDKIRVAVWSTSNQSNLKWYDATRVDTNGNGVFESTENDYKISVNIVNHNYEYGTYQIHAYAYAQNGVYQISKGTATLSVPTASVAAMLNAQQSVATVSITGVGYPGGVHGVRVAVWSEAGDQDDLRWYDVTNSGNGNWKTNVTISNHKTAGVYQAHAYIIDCNGRMHMIGKTTFTVAGITAKVTATIVKSASADAVDSQFDVKIEPTSAPSGLGSVRVAVWSTPNQSDLKWYTLTDTNKDGLGYKFRVDIRNHNCNMGIYQIHAYITANNGVTALSKGTATISAPAAHVVLSTTANQSTTTMKVSDARWVNGVKGLRYAVWSEAGGQDDLRWYEATKDATGTWVANAQTINHKTAGRYQVHAYVLDQNNNLHLIAKNTYTITGPKAGVATISGREENTGLFSVGVTGIPNSQYISQVKVAVWSDVNGQDDLVWYPATKQADGSYKVNADIRNHKGSLGKYQAHAYATDVNGISAIVGKTSTEMNIYVSDGLYPIMGSSNVTVDQMVRYYNSKATYPSFYAGSDAPDIKTFCTIYLDECNREGVKAEVAFAQAMKETGFLKYGGDVKINQYNFAGLGATGGGNPGDSFVNVRTGIRAQVQHLKAYATATNLNQTCVDKRYTYVTKGCAPYVQWLGQKENPQGKGWATAVRYGYSLVDDYICKLRSY